MAGRAGDPYLTRYIVDNRFALRLDPASGQHIDTIEDVVAAARSQSVAVAFTAVELEEAQDDDAELADEAAAEGPLRFRDRSVGWRLERDAALLADRLGPRAILTAYPVACRLGLKARGRLPGGPWLCVELVHDALWLCGGRGEEALQWRRLPADVDVADEIPRSIRAWRHIPDRAEIVVLAVGDEIAQRLAETGLRVTALSGPSPALEGLAVVPEPLRFWLPDVVAAREAAKRERRARRQRLVALSLALLTVGTAAVVEARLHTAAARQEAMAALIQAATKRRDDAAAAHVGTARRAVNEALLELIGRTYARLQWEPATCDLTFRSGRWTAACRTASWPHGAALAAMLGGEPPRPVLAGVQRGWEVVAHRPVPEWIDSSLR